MNVDKIGKLIFFLKHQLTFNLQAKRFIASGFPLVFFINSSLNMSVVNTFSENNMLGAMYEYPKNKHHSVTKNSIKYLNTK